jgi:O-Antigen ligase
MAYPLLILAVFLIVGVVGYFHGPRFAVGVGAILSMALPQWIHYEHLPQDFRLVVAIGLVCLGYYCLHPKAEYRTSLTWVDYTFIAFVLTGVVSDFWNDGVRLWVVVSAYGEWFVPFLLGRLSFCQAKEMRWLASIAMFVAIFLSIAAIIESSIRVNLFELMFGNRPSDLPKYLPRFRWQRAFGPTENPIFLGTLLVILFPWTIFVALRSVPIGKFWPIPMIAIHFLGILATVSRAPVLSVAIIPIVMCYLLWSRWRVSIAGVAIVLSILSILNWSLLKKELIDLGGERVRSTGEMITVDGQTIEYSNVDHRFLLWKVYWKAIEGAGALGYGTEQTATFPPNVPMDGRSDLKALENLWCIDNQFLLLLLRFGFCGMLLWIGLLAVTAATFGKLSQRPSEISMLYCILCGTIVSIGFIQMTVWMPMDYGFALTWTIGLAAGASALPSSALVSRRKS